MVGNFNFIRDRDDIGKLWENFLIVERVKKQAYQGLLSSFYFWRLASGAELDLVEEEIGKLTGYKFKFSQKTTRVPHSWGLAYPESKFKGINKDNYREFAL